MRKVYRGFLKGMHKRLQQAAAVGMHLAEDQEQLKLSRMKS